MDQSGSTGGQGAPTGPTSGWSAPPPPPVQPGPKGFVYADVPNRAIAYIIDAIILFLVTVVIFVIIAGILGLGFVVSLVYLVISLAISGGYFIYTWTRMRATVGMKVLGMQIGDAGSGATLTQDQAIKRWLVLAGPAAIAQALSSISVIGPLLSLAAFGWFIYLVYTTYQSPTKQGWHDIYAHTMVVKATNTVG